MTSNNATAAQGSGGSLVFNTVTVEVDPGLYPFDYRTSLGEPWVTGPESFVVMPGLSFSIRVGAALPTVGFIRDIRMARARTLNPLGLLAARMP